MDKTPKSYEPALKALQAFLTLDLDRHLEGPFDPWPALKRLLEEEAASTPAYQQYLASHGLALGQVTSLETFSNLPLMTKPGYIKAYPLAERVPGGNLPDLDRVAVSSGSTGDATFWPRSKAHELPIAVRFEQVFKDSFKAHERSTLAIVCFALGNWVGGLFTTSCGWHLADKGYRLMVATPGNHLQEILRVVEALGADFDQVVLLGYPPFLRDVVDAGILKGIDWSSFSTRMVFAGEVFSEEWREALAKRAGSDTPHQDTASLYGTADAGVIGNETPYSIQIRRYLKAHPELQKTLFGESRLPTLVQYDPRDRYFEVVEGSLVISGRNGVPLVRYDIKDRGGLIAFEEMEEVLKKAKALDGILESLGPEPVLRPLPFVYVFGRSDFTVSYYGANIFPENVTVGLEKFGILEQLTGKFILETMDEGSENPWLQVTVELRLGVFEDPDLSTRIAASIQSELLRLNSEYRHYVPPDRQRPRVCLKPFGDPQCFPPGVKHRYTRKPQGQAIDE